MPNETWLSNAIITLQSVQSSLFQRREEMPSSIGCSGISCSWTEKRLPKIRKETDFSSAIYSKSPDKTFSQCNENISVALLPTWCSVYAGYSNRLQKDQEPMFTLDSCERGTTLIEIWVHPLKFLGHSSRSIGQKYYFSCPLSPPPYHSTYSQKDWHIPHTSRS